MSRKAIIRVLAVLICVLTAGGFGVGYAAFQRVKSINNQDLLDAQLRAQEQVEQPEIEVDEDGDIVTPEEDDTDYVIYKGEKYSYNEQLLILTLLGIDKDPSRDSARSDVMVIFTVDAGSENHEANMIICPRDTQTTVRHTDKEGNETKRTLTKLNHSFPYGNGNNDRNMGARNVLYNISNLLSCDGKYNVPLALYGGLDMQGIGPLTDAVGGVTLEMPATISGVGRKGETVKLNGERAKLYNTTRYYVGGGSDISRGERQMVYLKALLKSIKDIDPLQIPSVYNQITKNCFTNLNTEQMVGYAKVLANVDVDALTPVNLQGQEKRTDASYYVLYEDQLEELVINTFYKKIEDGQKPSTSGNMTDGDVNITDLQSPSESLTASPETDD